MNPLFYAKRFVLLLAMLLYILIPHRGEYNSVLFPGTLISPIASELLQLENPSYIPSDSLIHPELFLQPEGAEPLPITLQAIAPFVLPPAFLALKRSQGHASQHGPPGPPFPHHLPSTVLLI